MDFGNLNNKTLNFEQILYAKKNFDKIRIIQHRLLQTNI